MKKIIASTLLCLSMASGSLAWANGKEIFMPIGGKTAGKTASMSTLIADGLKARGYRVDYRLIGNCGPVKEMLEKGTGKTLVTLWSNDWQAGDTCNIPVQERQFVGTVWTNPYSLCTRNGSAPWQWQAGKTYKVATNPVDGHAKVLDPLSKLLGVKLEQIQYKNSGAIMKAFKSGEVDVVYAAIGPELTREKAATCQYTTASSKWLGAEPLFPLLKGQVINAKAAFISWVLVDSRFNDADTQQLHKDIREILAGKEIQAALEHSGSLQLNGPVKDQVKSVHELTEAMK